MRYCLESSLWWSLVLTPFKCIEMQELDANLFSLHVLSGLKSFHLLVCYFLSAIWNLRIYYKRLRESGHAFNRSLQLLWLWRNFLSAIWNLLLWLEFSPFVPLFAVAITVRLVLTFALPSSPFSKRGSACWGNYILVFPPFVSLFREEPRLRLDAQ